MFSNRSYMKLWNIKKSERGNYYEAELSSSRKKDDGTFETDFSSKFVRFVGKAAEKSETVSPKSTIQITNCGVTNFYDKEKKREYINYVVFDFEVPDFSGSGSEKETEKKPAKPSKKEAVPEYTPDDSLPF